MNGILIGFAFIVSVLWLQFAFRYNPAPRTLEETPPPAIAKRIRKCNHWRMLAQDVHLDLLCIRHGTHKPSDLDLDHLAYRA